MLKLHDFAFDDVFKRVIISCQNLSPIYVLSKFVKHLCRLRIFFLLISPKNIYCGYSLEWPHVSWRNEKKNAIIFCTKICFICRLEKSCSCNKGYWWYSWRRGYRWMSLVSVFSWSPDRTVLHVLANHIAVKPSGDLVKCQLTWN